MEMTYAALAKSLGITLKSASSNSSIACTNAGSAPVSVPTQVPIFTSITVEKAEEEKPPPAPELAIVEKNEQEKETDGKEVKQDLDAALTSASPVPRVVEKLQGEEKTRSSPEARDDSDASDADAEGESDSDIASSRPCSPIAITTVPRPSTQDSSQEENSAMETMESQSTQPSSVAQDTDINEDQGRDPKEEIRPTSETPSSPQSESVERRIMTDDQLHQAKVLVLDLLGWGVPPEYLLQRGISHALLYTVFTDLRLRLPDNIWADCIKLVSAQS